MEKQQNKYKNRMVKKIALLLISLFTISVSAQITEEFDYANPKTCEIGGITVSGAKHLNSSALITISGLMVGEEIKIPGDNISSAISKLWEQGLFSDIDISIEKQLTILFF